MKTKSLILLAVALLSLTGYSQTNGFAPMDNASFYASAQGYFTSFNPEFEGTFTNNAGSAWTGVVSVQGAGVPLQNEIGISYKIYKAMQAEVIIRDSGVAGVLVSVGGGIGFTKVVHDVKLTLALDGGVNLARAVRGDKAFGEVVIRIQKALTKNTFAGISAAVEFPRGNRAFQAFTGFVF